MRPNVTPAEAISGAKVHMEMTVRLGHGRRHWQIPVWLEWKHSACGSRPSLRSKKSKLDGGLEKFVVGFLSQTRAPKEPPAAVSRITSPHISISLDLLPPYGKWSSVRSSSDGPPHCPVSHAVAELLCWDVGIFP